MACSAEASATLIMLRLNFFWYIPVSPIIGVCVGHAPQFVCRGLVRRLRDIGPIERGLMVSAAPRLGSYLHTYSNVRLAFPLLF
jgi:hypothetical protein